LYLKNIGSSKRSGVLIGHSGSAVLVSIILELSVSCAAAGAIVLVRAILFPVTVSTSIIVGV